MESPVKSTTNIMNINYGTPFKIPSSPFMETLGYGTGVNVFRVRRNTIVGDKLNFNSPWAVKSVSRRKILNDDRELYEERLTQEAELLRSLNHPNIVGFRAFKKSNDGRDCLAMEDCNISLGDILEQRYEEERTPLPPQHINKFMMDISSALNYLHTEAFLLHGDIKSFNILIKGNFEIFKLCDFGVSQPIGADGYIDNTKKPGACYIGTSLWSAPEVLTNEPENASTKADIFSFGLVVYETLSLQPPHTINNDDDDIVSENSSNSESIGLAMNSESFFGTRPSIPDDIELSDEYNHIIEIFFICTNADPESRPSAKLINDFVNSKK